MRDFLVSGLASCPAHTGRARLPGDKSISHRVLLLASLTAGPTRISHLNRGGAVIPLVRALRTLGVGIRWAGADVVIAPPERFDFRGGCYLNLGSSSAAARLLIGVISGLGGSAVVDGEAGLRERPMAWVVEPLRQLGADIRYLGSEGHLPVRVAPAKLRDGSVEMTAGSAQSVSAVLLAGVAGSRDINIRMRVRSRDHTQRLLRALGVDIQEDGLDIRLRPSPLPPMPEYDVPSDPSAAACVAAAHVMQKRVEELKLEHVCLNTTRTGMFDVLRSCGVSVRLDVGATHHGEPVGTVHVAGNGRYRPFDVSDADLFHALIDEAPLASVLAVTIAGESRIAQASELVFKETNRIESTRDMLRAFGARVEVSPDSLVITGGHPIQPGTIPTKSDHRIAMAATALACSLRGVSCILDGMCCQTSFPSFPALMRSYGFDVRSPVEAVS